MLSQQNNFLDHKKKKKKNEKNPAHENLQTEVDENLITQKVTPNIFAEIDKQEESEFFNVLEDGRVTRFNYQRFKAIELACNFFSILGVILSIFQFDKEYNDPQSDVNFVLLWFILVTTVILVILTYFKYRVLMKFQISQKNITSKDTIKSAGLLPFLILEILVQIPIPFVPFYDMRIPAFNYPDQLDFTYTLNSIFSLWILFRIPLFMQTLFNQTIYASHRSQRIGKMYGCDAESIFALRCIMKNSPFYLVTILLVMTIFVFGHALRICERFSPNDQGFGYYWNCMWLVILTMTTVGYGDFYPTTVLGRIILFMVCIWGICLLSLMVITITNILSLNNLENKAMNLIMRLSKRQDLRDHAADILTKTAKFSIQLKKSKENNEQETNKFMEGLKKKLNDFKNMRRQIKSNFEGTTLGEDMDMNFFFLNEDLKDLEKNLDRQLAVSKAVADHMKIKYNDILIQKTNIKENFDFPSSPISLIPNEDEEKADKEGLNENIRRSFLNKIN